MSGIEQTRPRGILDPGGAASRFRVDYAPPPPDLAAFLEEFWILHWDVPAPYRQRVLTHPVIHVTFTSGGRARVAGVMRTTFEEEIDGTGRVIGARFRPGGFRPFLGAPLSTIAGRFLPVEEVFGPASRKVADAVIAEPSPPRAQELVCDLLRSRDPVPDPLVETVGELVTMIDTDPALLRVSQLADAAGMTPRALQRLFAEYVGAGPKWAIRRSRMQEAAERAATAPQNWACLAAELGYADQAHFTRDFTAAVGVPPERYAAATRPN